MLVKKSIVKFVCHLITKRTELQRHTAPNFVKSI